MSTIFSRLGYLFRQAWRSLKRKPGFGLSVVITMGLTLGALLCVSTLAYLLIIKPLPYADQDRLYRVDYQLVNPSGRVQIPAFTYPGIMHLRQTQDVFSATALISYGNDVVSSAANQPVVNIGYITPDWFPLFDGTFVVGRGFSESEAIDTNNPVAILSYQTWKREFDSNPNILSESLSISGINYRVVGVVAESFVEPQIHGLATPTEIWLPWDYNFGKKWRDKWIKFTGSLTFIGKLEDGISRSQAQQQISRSEDELWQANVAGYDYFKGAHIKVTLVSFVELILGDSQSTVYLLLGGILGLVVIAFANIANLFMSRTAEQQQTLAIHAAVGAKKGQLFVTLFAETSLLMFFSICIALIVADAGFWVLQKNLVSVLPRVQELEIDLFTLGAAIGVVFLFSVLFALLNRNMIHYHALSTMLQSSGKGVGIQVSKHLRQILITSQIAIATVLVFVNLSLFQASMATITAPLGFELENTTYLTLSYGGRSRPPLEEVAPIMKEVRSKLLQFPEIESLSQSYSPLQDLDFQRLAQGDGGEALIVQPRGVDSGYFKTIGQSLLEGVYFSPADFADGRRVAIVNDVVAQKLAPNGSALGPSTVDDGPPVMIVGVVKGIKNPGESSVAMRYYYPLHPGETKLLIKLHDNQSLSRHQVGKLLREIGSQWSVWKFESLQENANKRLFAQTTTAVTTAVLTVITFFLAGVGLYGVLSYSTQMRRFEIGARLAIGAKRRDIIRLIVGDNARSISVGVVVGVVVLFLLAYGFSQQLESYFDWQLLINLGGTLFLIGLISFFACYAPLRRYIDKPVVNSLRGSE